MQKFSIDYVQQRYESADQALGPDGSFVQEGFMYLPAVLWAKVVMDHLRSEIGKTIEVTSERFINFNFPNVSLDPPSDLDCRKIVCLSPTGLLSIPNLQSIMRHYEELYEKVTFVVGGQPVDLLSEEEFRRLFKKTPDRNVINGNTKEGFYHLFEDSSVSIPNICTSSFIPGYNLVSDEQMKRFLENEFSFFISQGCKFSCSFCQAMKGRPEVYRDLFLIEKDLRYLVQRAKELEVPELQFYISNLDMFQQADKLLEVGKLIEKVSKELQLPIQYRGLSTLVSFQNAYKKQPSLLHELRRTGLKRIAFGFDGFSDAILDSQNKKHNKHIEFEKVVQEAYASGIVSELLVVLGFREETSQSLEAAHRFCSEMADLYASIPRPHIAREGLPGSNEWIQDPNLREWYLADPARFAFTDYTAYASEESHPHHTSTFINEINTTYDLIRSLSEESTQAIYPPATRFLKLAEQQGKTLSQLNMGRFDR